MSRHPDRSPAVFSPTTLNVLLGIGLAFVAAGIAMLVVGVIADIPEPRDTNLIGCGATFIAGGLLWSLLIGGVKSIDAYWDQVWEEPHGR